MAGFSIAIPTRNRPDVLRVLLSSILKQTTLPKEVIIVDDSDNDQTEKLAKQMKAAFTEKEIPLKYLRGGGESVVQARNIGIDSSTGEIHCSVDDDVVLDKDYIENILSVYRSHPEAAGVAGHMENLYLSGLSNAVNTVFGFFSTEPDRCRVFPTGTSYPVPLTRVINCEWLSGTNCSYRKAVLANFRWDENLKKYSLCDDMDISYRIHKWRPNSLCMTPYAKVIHTHSELARITSEERLQMEISYHAYFFFKNIRHTYANTLKFVYGIFLGRLLLSIFSKNPAMVVSTLKAQLHLVKNVGNVRRGVFN